MPHQSKATDDPVVLSDEGSALHDQNSLIAGVPGSGKAGAKRAIRNQVTGPVTGNVIQVDGHLHGGIHFGEGVRGRGIRPDQAGDVQ